MKTKSESEDFLDHLVTQATKKFEAMLADARAGKTATGYAELGKILDTISAETWRKK